MLEAFKKFLVLQNYSPYTQRDYLASVESWKTFCQKNNLEINDGHLLNTFLQRRAVGKRTLNHDLSALRTFFHFLSEQYRIAFPKELEHVSPKFESRLPNFFTVEQINKLLDTPNVLFSQGQLKEFIWRRDRAVLELLYGGGIRVGELVNLKRSDLDSSRRLIRVMGKGHKERLIPIGIPALEALTSLHAMITSEVLIPGESGKKLTTRAIQLLIKKYLTAANLPLNMTPHSCRHSYATHMLQNGADLRVVQELLGHANLSTTQKYTHVNINFLQKVYHHSHPQK